MEEEVLKLWLPRLDHAAQDDAPNSSRPIHLIDGTLGLAGHTVAAMKTEHSGNVHILGIDRDSSAISKSMRCIRRYLTEETNDDNMGGIEQADPLDEAGVSFHHGSFSEISPDLLSQYSFPTKVDGILIDCGLNSDQIDNPTRGFTFRKNGPLDMRFDHTTESIDHTTFQHETDSTPARDILNLRPASELADLFRKYSDEPHADEIAANIIQWRESSPPLKRKHNKKKAYDDIIHGGIRTTLELRFVIEEAVEKVTNPLLHHVEGKNRYRWNRFRQLWRKPNNAKGKVKGKSIAKTLKKYSESKSRHPNNVTRIFQALRIEVNRELEHIQSVFRNKIPSRCLEVGGRLVMIAFQPGEDEMVKSGMGDLVASGEFKLLTPDEEGLRPAVEEVEENEQSRTARLHAVERIK